MNKNYYGLADTNLDKAEEAMLDIQRGHTAFYFIGLALVQALLAIAKAIGDLRD